MAEKKKQASIAAFFSPQARSSKPAAKAKLTEAASTKASAEKAKSVRASPSAGKDNDAAGSDPRTPPASATKRSRVEESAAPDSPELTPVMQTPPPTQPGDVEGDQEMTPVMVSVAGKLTVTDLFTTPPPTKRAKHSVQPSEEKKAVNVIDVSSATEEDADQDASDNDDEDDDDDDDDSPSTAGPHAGGPHATPAAANKKPRQSRAKKQSKATPAAAATSAGAARPSKTKGKTTVRTPKPRASDKAKPKTDNTSTATPKVKEKKPAKAGSEKAATAADAARSEQKQAAVVLDPAVKARIDTYQQKIDELTRQCAHLLSAPTTSDGILQEIYGVAIDLGLEPNGYQETVSNAVAELSRQLSHQSTASDGLEAVAEFSADIKTFVARSIQGRTASLSSLSLELLKTLEQSAKTESNDAGFDAKMKDRVLMMLKMEIKMLAQRTNYGVRPAKANLFEDTSADALWIWEIGILDKYFVDDSQKTIKRMRKNRKRLGQQLKSLARVVQLLHQVPVDEVKVSAEEAKIGKFVTAIESETQKAKDRERKEQDKAQLAEQKRLHELEKEQAKQEEKRKREEDEEAEKILANKRKKSLVSYFRSIDKSAGESAAPAALATGSGSNAAQSDEVEIISNQDETMARMDSAIDFLVGGDKAKTQPEFDATTKSTVEVRALLLPNGSKKPRVTASSGHWSGKRRRDPVLGSMKMLQFHENSRPAYYGTFSTKSKVFHGGRRPFAQYSKFDYTVDSEEEWEEEEPGESLSDADSDMDESDDDLDYGDQWLAYEDEVDYIDEEMKDDDRDDGKYLSSPERKKKVPPQLEQKKRARVPGKKKGAKPAKLEPQIVGPSRCLEVSCAEHFGEYQGQMLQQPVFESTLLRKAREYEVLKEEQERERLLQVANERQKLLLEHQEKKQRDEKQKQQDASLVAREPVAEKPSEDTPKPKTPQKRKRSAENTKASPATASNSTTPVQPVKAGITAWLKKPAVVDLSKQDSGE